MVHTHPLSAFESAGVISPDHAQAVREGRMPRLTFGPSSIDWVTYIQNEFLYEYPQGQLSGKIHDLAGEWEYGIVDSGSPFIAGMRRFLTEVASEDYVVFNSEEKQYLRVLKEEYPEEYHMTKALNLRTDPLAASIKTKLQDRLGTAALQNISVTDLNDFTELVKPFDPYLTSIQRKEKIANMEQIAGRLGFWVRYTVDPTVPQPPDQWQPVE
jgi:hypothetical protein